MTNPPIRFDLGVQPRLDELAEQLSRREGEVVDYPRLQKELKNAREQLELLRKGIKAKLQANLGIDYCNWTYSLDKILDKVSREAGDDNFWKEQIRELEDQIHLRQQTHNHELRSQIQVNQTQQQKLAELETKLEAAEVEQKQDLARLQELNHELNEVQGLNQKLQQDNQDLLNDIKHTIQTHDQKILALEADKQDLIQQLSQTKQKLQTYLSQEKQLIQREIQLIKEVLND